MPVQGFFNPENAGQDFFDYLLSSNATVQDAIIGGHFTEDCTYQNPFYRVTGADGKGPDRWSHLLRYTPRDQLGLLYRLLRFFSVPGCFRVENRAYDKNDARLFLNICQRLSIFPWCAADVRLVTVLKFRPVDVDCDGKDYPVTVASLSTTTGRYEHPGDSTSTHPNPETSEANRAEDAEALRYIYSIWDKAQLSVRPSRDSETPDRLTNGVAGSAHGRWGPLPVSESSSAGEDGFTSSRSHECRGSDSESSRRTKSNDDKVELETSPSSDSGKTLALSVDVDEFKARETCHAIDMDKVKDIGTAKGADKDQVEDHCDWAARLEAKNRRWADEDMDVETWFSLKPRESEGEMASPVSTLLAGSHELGNGPDSSRLRPGCVIRRTNNSLAIERKNPCQCSRESLACGGYCADCKCGFDGRIPEPKQGLSRRWLIESQQDIYPVEELVKLIPFTGFMQRLFEFCVHVAIVVWLAASSLLAGFVAFCPSLGRPSETSKQSPSASDTARLNLVCPVRATTKDSMNC